MWQLYTQVLLIIKIWIQVLQIVSELPNNPTKWMCVLGNFFFFFFFFFEIREAFRADLDKVKVGVLPQHPGSYWDRSSALPLVGLEPTEVRAHD